MRSVALVLLVFTLMVLAFATPVMAAVPKECGTPKYSGICGGKVEVSNMYLGARAESLVWIYNGRDFEAVFDLYYKHPDAVQWGFEKPPVEAREWVTVGGQQPGAIETVRIPPHQWASVLIALELPAELPLREAAEGEKPERVTLPNRWEFRIKIIERQTSMVIEAYEQRWIIEMAPPGFSLALVIGAATGALIVGGAIGAYVMRRRAHR